MTTIQQPKNKELTAKQYEFYKRKGMTDEKVMKLHGFNNASFYAWKEQHNLKGVKFEKDVKVVKSNDMANVQTVDNQKSVLREKEVEPTRVYENKQAKARLSGFKVESEHELAEEEKQPETHERYEIFNAVELETLGGLSVGSPQNVPLNTDNHVNLIQLENEELKQQLISLEERHVKDAEQFYQMELRLKKSEERGSDFCDKMVAANRLHRETEEKLQNALNQIKRQDELLIKADRERKLLFQTMELAVEQQKAIQSSVESGEF